jgi:DNA-binding GntR family transcriptional regulator
MPAKILPIARPQLHEQVAAQLRASLIEGRIAPGAKLNERELCSALNVSRTPLREAMKLLAAEGLVDLLPNRGAAAVRLSQADVHHAFELLAELEGLSGELAAVRISDAARAEIRALHFEMLACHARQDLPAYYQRNARIHAAINQAAGNPLLTRTYGAINARVQSLRFRTNLDAQKWQLAVEEHQRMVETLERRDGAQLRRVLTEHMLHKRDAVLMQMRAGEPLAIGDAG